MCFQLSGTYIYTRTQNPMSTAPSKQERLIMWLLILPLELGWQFMVCSPSLLKRNLKRLYSTGRREDDQ